MYLLDRVESDIRILVQIEADVGICKKIESRAKLFSDKCFIMPKTLDSHKFRSSKKYSQMDCI